MHNVPDTLCSVVTGRQTQTPVPVTKLVEVKKPSLQLMYELKEALKQLFNCDVDLVRFRDSLRPLFKSNIERDVIYV